MAKVLTSFLTKNPVQLGFLGRGIPISKARIQATKPGLYHNLQQSCKAYIQGIIDLDQQFLKQTSSPFLFSQIENQLKELKQHKDSPNSPLSTFAQEFKTSENYQQKKQQILKQSQKQWQKQKKEENRSPFKIQMKVEQHILQGFDRFQMVVSPYVIFGSRLSQRINRITLDNVQQITRNRYVASKSPQMSFGNYLSSLFAKNRQVFGFRCFLGNQTKSYEITFQGDIENSQYYVVDLNNQLQALKYN